MRKQFDVKISENGVIHWITELHVDTKQRAVAEIIHLIPGCKILDVIEFQLPLNAKNWRKV